MKAAGILLIIALALAIPAEAWCSDTGVTVVVGFGVVIGGISIFFALSSGHYHSRGEEENVEETKAALGGEDLESMRLQYHNPLPLGNAEPGMVTLLSW